MFVCQKRMTAYNFKKSKIEGIQQQTQTAEIHGDIYYRYGFVGWFTPSI